MEPVKYPADLAEMFSDIARRLYSAETVEDTLQEIAQLACKTVEGCNFAGMSIVRGKAIETPAQTDPAVGELDAIQSEMGTGPCVDAIIQHQTFYVEDLRSESRWPTFARRCWPTRSMNTATAGSVEMRCGRDDAPASQCVASMFSATPAITRP